MVRFELATLGLGEQRYNRMVVGDVFGVGDEEVYQIGVLTVGLLISKLGGG
jgi:hypothetical protein